MAKYGNAVVLAKKMYRLAQKLRKADIAFELSVDETDAPTTLEEHLLIAHLCKRLEIQLFSLAPRFVGRFNKGVEYVPSEEESFPANLALHHAIARRFGYKLSIHSGSDKFSIYRKIGETTSGEVHVKTSGTSYLVALQVIALTEPELFLEIFRRALSLYPEASKTYHVDADPQFLGEKALAEMRSDELHTLTLGYHGRQILHVAFGQLLTEFAWPIFETLRQNERLHDDLLAAHMRRHLRPFSYEETC
jgi:hypothetical protein